MAESYKFAEKRRVPRIQVDFPVRVSWGRKQFRCGAGEFSEYGILLHSSEKVMMAQELMLEFALESDHDPLVVQGIVAYSNEKGIGVRFKNISPEAQHSFTHFVKNHGIGISH